MLSELSNDRKAKKKMIEKLPVWTQLVNYQILTLDKVIHKELTYKKIKASSYIPRYSICPAQHS